MASKRVKLDPGECESDPDGVSEGEDEDQDGSVLSGDSNVPSDTVSGLRRRVGIVQRCLLYLGRTSSEFPG